MSEKTFCLKHYRQTFPDKGCDICELESELNKAKDLTILRRIAERGLKDALHINVTHQVDCWQHLIDELERMMPKEKDND